MVQRHLRRCWLVLGLLFAVSAQADPVTLDFRAVTVPELADVVFRKILKRDYMLGSGLGGGDPKLTLSIKGAETSEVGQLVSAALAEHGIAVDLDARVIRIYRAASSVGTGSPDTIAPYMQPGIAVGKTTEATSPQSLAQPPMSPGPVIPEKIVSYTPRGKSVDFLESLVKLAGGVTVEGKGEKTSLIYGGSAEIVEKIEKLLEQVDTITPGLMVKAALIEFTESDTESRSFQLALNALAGKLGVVLSAGTQLANAITWKGATLTAALSAIEGDSRFSYVAEPQLRVSDGEKAKLVVGAEVPTRGTATFDRQGNPVQSIQYRTSGVVISVQPKVMKDSVLVKIAQQVSSFAMTTTSNIDSPTMLKRETETTVRARPGELIVLAGLDENRNTKTSSGLSWLPSFMKSNSRDNSRSQLLLFIEVTMDKEEEA
jgi:general secretion pathway protein D